jgi:hypothetical protein
VPRQTPARTQAPRQARIECGHLEAGLPIFPSAGFPPGLPIRFSFPSACLVLCSHPALPFAISNFASLSAPLSNFTAFKEKCQEKCSVRSPFLGIAGTKQDQGIEKTEIRISKSETNSKFKGLKKANKGASRKSHSFCHSGESRNPELLKNPGFRVAPGLRRDCPE